MPRISKSRKLAVLTIELLIVAVLLTNFYAYTKINDNIWKLFIIADAVIITFLRFYLRKKVLRK